MPCSIGIIDYGLGNLRSVQKALEHVGARADILTSSTDLTASGEIDKLILPGVGAFGDGMTLLKERGWIPPLRDLIASGKPVLGICLGMQLLFEGSEEDAPAADRLVPGLGVLAGTVVRFREDRGQDQPLRRSSLAPQERRRERLKVPHMGWNTLRWDRDDPLLRELDQDAAVYFVHSYYVNPTPDEARAPLTSATADYGGPFCASIWRDNLWATQFHPEKSQRVGLTILKNFASM